MSKRLTATFLAAASVCGALVAAAPAAAQQTNPAGNPSCSAYPARDGAYGMRVSPTQLVVNPGSRVRVSSRVFRNGQPCPERPVGFYTRGTGQPYRLTAKDMTDGAGLASAFITANRDFRFYGNYNTDPNTVGARAFGLVQVRRR